MLALALVASLLAGVTDAPPTLLIVPLDAQAGVTAAFADSVTRDLVHECSALPHFTVTSMKDVNAELQIEAARQFGGIDSPDRLRKLADGLHSDLVMLGSVGKVGNSHLINVRVIRLSDASVVASVSKRVKTGGETAVKKALPGIAKRLMEDAANAPRQPGSTSEKGPAAR